MSDPQLKGSFMSSAIVEGVMAANHFATTTEGDVTTHQRVVTGLRSCKSVRIVAISREGEPDAELIVTDATRIPGRAGGEVGTVITRKVDTYVEIVSDAIAMVAWILRHG
jgi:hypothetical protein